MRRPVASCCALLIALTVNEGVANAAEAVEAAGPINPNYLVATGYSFDILGYGVGAAAGVRLNDFSALELEGTLNRFHLIKRYESTAIALGLRAFIKNSWGFRVGIRYVRSKQRDDFTDAFVTNVQANLSGEPSVGTASTIASMIGASVGFGTRWRWNRVLLTIDFIDAYMPLIVVSSRAVIATRPDYIADVRELTRSETFSDSWPELRLLQVGVGVAF
jgi:hypothetical protein